MRDFISPIRDGTHTSAVEMQSEPLDFQGSPLTLIFFNEKKAACGHVRLRMPYKLIGSIVSSKKPICADK